MPKRTILVNLFLLVALSVTIVFAQGQKEEVLPLPNNTREIKREGPIVYYRTTESSKEIRDFYIRRLPILGWEALHVSEQNLIFEKDQEILSLVFLLADLAQDSHTQFVLARSKKEASKNIEGKASAPPKDFSEVYPSLQIPQQPKEEVAPVYPGASLVGLSEEGQEIRMTYITNAPVEDVSSFYEKEMSDYGWNLTNQPELETLSQRSKVKDSHVGQWTTELNFLRQDQAHCRIFISDIVLGDEPPFSSDMTTIIVNYDTAKE